MDFFLGFHLCISYLMDLFLIENLNAMDADLIFIKNIDNVVVSQYAQEVANYKKVLAGILLQKQAQAFHYLMLLDQGKLSEKVRYEIADFLSNQLKAQGLKVRIKEDFKYSAMKKSAQNLRV